MEQLVTFTSDGLTLRGVLHTPSNISPGEKRPALIVLHGFGSNKDGATHRNEAQLYCDLGYIALRFDMRGCGESGGVCGSVLCLDQVADARNAVTWLQQHPNVDPARIGIAGQSFGGAVAAYTAGVDERIGAVISFGGWGDGEAKFRRQHSTPEQWQRFTELLERGRALERDGCETLMVSRWDIVPVPQVMRDHLPPGSIMQFPYSTAQSMFEFKPNEVVGRIAPRPFLILHAARDAITPVEQSISMFRTAGAGAELMILADTTHFPYLVPSRRLRSLISGWLSSYFPVDMPA